MIITGLVLKKTRFSLEIFKIKIFLDLITNMFYQSKPKHFTCKYFYQFISFSIFLFFTCFMYLLIIIKFSYQINFLEFIDEDINEENKTPRRLFLYKK